MIISQLLDLLFFALSLVVERIKKINQKTSQQELENLLTKIYMVLTSINTFVRLNIGASTFGLCS